LWNKHNGPKHAFCCRSCAIKQDAPTTVHAYGNFHVSWSDGLINWFAVSAIASILPSECLLNS
jgi:hypothetical protein